MVLAGRPVEHSSDMDAMHEHYITVLGMAEGVSEATADGWRVRCERQLTRPAETVWDLLTGPRPPTAGDPPPGDFTTDSVAAGTVTEVNPPTLLEFEGPGGRVRWELGHGTGHGARLVLTHSGPSEQAGARSTTLVAWQAHIEQLAAKLLTLPGST